MEIAANRVVGLSYTMRDANEDEELERYDKDDLDYYIHGQEGFFPGLERALEGCVVGDTFDVVLEPEDAFGDYNPKEVQSVSRDEFPDDFELEVGLFIEMIPSDADEGDGGIVYWIKEFGEKEVLIDGNHPLAGKKLHFQGEVVEVREAEDDELAHGHVHADGCHHDHDFDDE